MGPKRLKYILVYSLLFFLCSWNILAEGVQEESEAMIRIEDSLGRSVVFTSPPERIVMAGRAVIMLADALYLFPGVEERVVAVGQTNQGRGDFFPVLDPGAQAKVRLGRSAGPEEILAQNPDLILLKSYMRDSIGMPLETAGASVVYLDLETPEQFNRDIRILGELLKQEARAEELIELFGDRQASIENSVAGRERKETLLLSYSANSEGYSFSIPPRGWIQSTQVELAGGEPVWLGGTLSPGWNRVEFEQIAAWDPEAIVVLSYRQEASDAIELIRGEPLWRELRAVKKGELYAMPGDFYSWGQPDPRWILGAEWIAHALHPEAFDSPFEERISAFFEDFYAIDRERFERLIEPRLTGDLF